MSAHSLSLSLLFSFFLVFYSSLRLASWQDGWTVKHANGTLDVHFALQWAECLVLNAMLALLAYTQWDTWTHSLTHTPHTRLLWPEHVCFISCSVEGAWRRQPATRSMPASLVASGHTICWAHASICPSFTYHWTHTFAVCSRDGVCVHVCVCVCEWVNESVRTYCKRKRKCDLVGTSGINHWGTVIRNVIGHIDQVPHIWWILIDDDCPYKCTTRWAY